MQKILKIKGMHCEKCAQRLTSSLSAIKGVSQVKVDLNSASATLSADDGICDADLVEAIESIGFDVVSIT